jgi:uncharacterized protein (DUF1778 family)
MSNSYVGFRIEPADRQLLQKVCKARGEDLSDFVRRAIKKELASLSFYNQETKKALGILKGGE